ncbi:MAG: hypothetical protein QXW80_05905 [Candidatus Micrarchaeia archaeon]
MKPEEMPKSKPIFNKVGFIVRTRSKAMGKIYVEKEGKAYYFYWIDLLNLVWGTRKGIAIYTLEKLGEKK